MQAPHHQYPAVQQNYQQQSYHYSAQQTSPIQYQPRPRIDWVGPSLTKAGGIALAVIILSVTGMIMDASDVPWIWSNGESMDGDELRDEQTEGKVGVYDTMIHDSTMWFVLGLIFAVVILMFDIIPMHTLLRDCSQSLLAIAMLVTGVFALRTTSFWLAWYFGSALNIPDPDFHLHTMVYFIGVFSITMLIGGVAILSNRWKRLPASFSNEQLEHVFGVANGIIIACVVALLISPIVPIVYMEHDLDAEPETDRSHYMVTAVLVDAEVIDDDEFQQGFDEEAENYVQLVENYNHLDNIFVILLWIQAGVLVTLCFSFIPRSRPIVEGIVQFEILTLGLIVWMIICNIFVYSAIPNLQDDSDSPFSSSLYENVSYHANWIMPISTIFVFVMWFTFLFRCHIPWWQKINQSARDAESQRMAMAWQQPMVQQQHMVAQTQQHMVAQTQQQPPSQFQQQYPPQY